MILTAKPVVIALDSTDNIRYFIAIYQMRLINLADTVNVTVDLPAETYYMCLCAYRSFPAVVSRLWLEAISPGIS